MNKELTMIVILLFAIILGVKALEDPNFQPSIEQSIEVEVQNIMQKMVGDSFNYTVFDANDLIPDTFYGVKP